MIESQPRQDGRNMTMVLHPTKKETKKEKPERTPKPESRQAESQQAESRQAEKVSTAPAAVPAVEASVADVPPPVDNGVT
jgi:translation initiation factor IF-3